MLLFRFRHLPSLLVAFGLLGCGTAPQTTSEPPAPIADTPALKMSPEAAEFQRDFERRITAAQQSQAAPPLSAETTPDEQAQRLAELVAVDQTARGAVNAVFAEFTAQHDIDALVDVIGRKTMALDAEHTAELRRYVGTNGWFRTSTHGADAVRNAWLLAQHADADRPFQHLVLTLMKPLVKSGEVPAEQYAYLWDRVAVGEGKAQRYGTQGNCEDGWTPFEIANVEQLDERRADMGLEPMEAYVSKFAGMCG